MSDANQLPDPEKMRRMMACFDAMKRFTEPGITALYDVIDERTGQLAASGTFIANRSERYILSAGHALWEATKHNGLAHSTKNEAKPRFIANPMKLAGHPYDLGIVRLDSDALDDTEHVAVDSSKLAVTSEGVESDLLFIHGYPGKTSRHVALLETVFATSLPYGAATSSSQYPWFDPKLHIALDFSPRGMVDEHGRDANFIDPHGLSGSALWKTNRAGKTEAEWSPADARIVGVIFAWDEKANSLIATRIEVVRDFILGFVRDEFAYFRWHDNGRPPNTSYSDWIAAVDAIKSI